MLASAPTAPSDAGPFPPEFDAELYRRENPELRAATAAELDAHFRSDGAAAGRRGSAISSRAAFVALLESATSVLEIGPLAQPALRGPRVKYFDVLATAALRRKAADHGLDPASCPEIDYVSATGDLAVVDATFGAVLSCHVIEHQPDLIRHLIGVARVLDRGGRYFLAIPDKRYCFDHFIAASSVADVLDAYVSARRTHSLASLVEHCALITHNDARRHWAGDHGEPACRAAPATLRHALSVFLLRGATTYIDCHAWQFTPESFRELIDTLGSIGFSPFRVLRVYPTVRGALEFYAILEKTRDGVDALVDGLPADFDEREYLLANPDVARAGVDARLHYLAHGCREGRRLRRES